MPGAVHLDAEQVRGMGNAEIRRLHPAALVVVEAQGRECRHDDRAVGDMVLVLEAGPTHAA